MIMQGLAPSEWDDNKQTGGIDGKMQQLTDQQNIKCSIEIKNGIPQRSLNNFHKNQNALVLNNYTVRYSISIFSYRSGHILLLPY